MKSALVALSVIAALALSGNAFAKDKHKKMNKSSKTTTEKTETKETKETPAEPQAKKSFLILQVQPVGLHTFSHAIHEPPLHISTNNL